MLSVSAKDLIIQISDCLDAVERGLLGATRFHSKRVALFSIYIAKGLGYDKDSQFAIAVASLLHDNALTEYILSEGDGATKLKNLSLHCTLGEQNCEPLPFYSAMENFILYHHEACDGSGCFNKKIGEFPMEAGIIALADQVDVKFKLQSINASDLPSIKEYIRSESGKKYIPVVASMACDALNEEIMVDFKDENILSRLTQCIIDKMCSFKNRDLAKISSVFSKIIDYKSEFTKRHSTQIADKAWYMAKVYNFSEDDTCGIFLAASLHDVGKLFIPMSILEKEGPLTPDEFVTIKEHVVYSKKVLESVPGLETISRWATNHHEKLDGSGYPCKLKAEDLDFPSRLLCCLDIYQAVRELRPYHMARSHEETMAILYDMANKNLLDMQICKDLDANLKALKNGVAPKASYDERFGNK